MKLLIVTTLYKRPELTKIVLDYYKTLQFDYGFQLLACGSCDEDRQLALKSGWNYFNAENNPLAQKHNKLFQEARRYPHDAIMLIGSDDLISEEIIKHYMTGCYNDQMAMFGFNKLHFYSVEKDELIYFKGYPNDHTHRITMGAGRLFPKKVLARMDYNLWNESKLNRGLDSVVSTYLKYNDVAEIELKLEDIPGAMILDIKTETNITEYKRLLVNCNLCDLSEANKKFPIQMFLIRKHNERFGKGAANNISSNGSDVDYDYNLSIN